MAGGYEHLDDKPYDSHYLYFETVIDRPVTEIWPHVLNIGSWMSAHDLETLDGESGKVGHFERVHPRDLGSDVPPARYHLYGIAEIVPYKYLALEVMSEKGGSYGNAREWISLDGILFTDLGGRTQIVFLAIDVTPGKGDEEFHKRQQAKLRDGRALLEQYFANLRKLVENAS
jgi:hypothetical protein